MEAMDLEATTVALEPTEHTALEPTATLTPPPSLPPATPPSPPPPPSLLPASPEPSPLSLEATLPLDVTSPTLPESSMLPRGRLRLRLMPRLTPTTLTDTTDSATPDMLDTVWATPDTPATP